MAFIPPFFKNFGKTLSDLFKEQYDYSRQLKIKSTTANGVVLESSFKNGNEGGVKATCKQPDIGTLQAELYTTGSTKYSVKNEKLAKGLTLKLSGDEKPSGKVEIDYAQEHVATSLVADVAANTSLDAALVTGFEGLSVGGHYKHDVVAQQTKDYNVGAEYSFNDYTFTVKTSDAISKVSVGYLHRYSTDLQLGAQLAYDLKDHKNLLTVGTAYTVDKSTALKAKVDSQGLLAAVLEHKLPHPAAKIAISVENNAKAASTTPQSFGITLHLGDN